ncbi:4Fe-4S dicluster domain-containing protein [Propionibacteriaceae bacterium Y1923]
MRFTRVLAALAARPDCHVLVDCGDHPVTAADDPVEVGDAEVVRVVWPQCPTAAPDWMLVDLAVAAGGSVVVEAGGCESDSSGVADLAGLTGGRVQPGSIDAAPVAVLSVAHPPMSRRGMLGRAPAAVVEHADPDPRARLVESLRAMGGDVGGRSPALELDASACIACGVCVKACPHDALDLGTADGRTTLVHYPDRCRGEQACVASCPSRVMEVRGQHDWATVLAGRPLPLARLATTTCQKCRGTIPQGRTMCQACSDRARDPFGTHLPDHLLDSLPAKYRDRLRG